MNKFIKCFPKSLSEIQVLNCPYVYLEVRAFSNLQYLDGNFLPAPAPFFTHLSWCTHLCSAQPRPFLFHPSQTYFEQRVEMTFDSRLENCHWSGSSRSKLPSSPSKSDKQALLEITIKVRLILIFFLPSFDFSNYASPLATKISRYVSCYFLIFSGRFSRNEYHTL